MKFVIAGEASVGKTSILFRLTDERFLTTPDPTIGVEFGSKLLRVTPPSAPTSQTSSTDAAPSSSRPPATAGEDDEEAKWIKLQCWDVAGSPSFRAVTRSYYRGAAGALLVYDVTRRDTFEQIPSWLADIRAHSDPEVSIILVGNKADLAPAAPSASNDVEPSSEAALTPAPAVASSSRVTTAEGEAFAARESLLFLETSAKTGENVQAAFDATARAILGKILEGQLDAKGKKSDGRKGGIKLGETAADKSKGGCC